MAFSGSAAPVPAAVLPSIAMPPVHFLPAFAEHGDAPARPRDAAPLLTLPGARAMPTSIRATAQVFEDPRSLALLERIRLVAPSDANVLILGETGTGKELICLLYTSPSPRD